MKNPENVKFDWRDNRLLGRAVKVMVGLVALMIFSFASYYYWDRYIHMGDMSPIELGIAHLQQVAEENPNDPNTRLALIQHYIENKDYTKAILQAQNVLKAYPENSGALLLLGVAYTLSNQAQAAIQPLESFAAQRRELQDPQLDNILEASLFYLGKDYLILNLPENAIKVLTEALSIDQTDADVMYLLGTAYAQIDEHELALESYSNAVRFVPDFAEVYQGMEKSYQALGMDDHLLYAQGMQAFSTRNYSQARKYLEQATVSLPDYAPLYMGLAMTYEELSEISLAKTSIDQALVLSPNDFAANAVRSRLLLKNQ